MALNSYFEHLRANPIDRLDTKSSTPDDIIAHAKSLGHEITRDELDDHAHSDVSLDSAGGGSCYANNIYGCV